MINETLQVLIVGASSSIGHAVMGRFAARGAKILATGRNVGEVFCSGADLTVARLDLDDYESQDKFTSITVPSFGKLDVVIFLAGILPGKALADYNDQLIEDVMAVNFSYQATLLRRLLPHLNTGAHVIMISSVSAERGSYDPIYAASKAAQIAFVKSMATYPVAPNFRFNAIAPALIQDTNMFRAMTPERQNYHVLQTPTGRLVKMEEIAGVIVNICESDWKSLNGQIIRINGGAYV